MILVRILSRFFTLNYVFVWMSLGFVPAAFSAIKPADVLPEVRPQKKTRTPTAIKKTSEKNKVSPVPSPETSKSTSQPLGPTNQSVVEAKPKAFGPSLHLFESLMKFEVQQYMSPLNETTSLQSMQLLNVDLNYKYIGPTFKGTLDAGAGTFFKKTQSFYAVYELYVQNGVWLHSNDSLAFGRKKMLWSDLDQTWNFGLWQPKYATDPTRPKQQGLSGFFYELNGENVGFKLAVSPIYIPNVGPDIREENGSIVSDSRWYRPPSKTFNLFNKQNNIVYKIDVGDISQLINNQGLSSQISYRSSQNLWGRAGFAFKPLNEILLKREEYKNIDRSVNVTVRPQVAYHELGTLEVGYDNKEWSFSVSVMADKPYEKRPDSGWAVQSPRPLQIYGAQAAYDLSEKWLKPIRVSAAYMKTFGGEIIDIKSDGTQDEITLFDRRLPFSNALKVGLEGEVMRVRTRPVVAKVSYLADFDQRGTMFNGELEYNTQKNWLFTLGADVLGVEKESSETSFLNQFRANDRVYGGIGYVF